MAQALEDISLVAGYRPGLTADVIAAHMAYYAPVWGFGLPFEVKLAREMPEFLLRYDPARDAIISAFAPDGRFLGSVTLDGEEGDREPAAHLRWFITTDAVRGRRGLGRRMLDRALAFADDRGYGKVYLTTFAGLDAGRHLYESAGFMLTAETARDAWSGTVGEQRFERRRP